MGNEAELVGIHLFISINIATWHWSTHTRSVPACLGKEGHCPLRVGTGPILCQMCAGGEGSAGLMFMQWRLLSTVKVHPPPHPCTGPVRAQLGSPVALI